MCVLINLSCIMCVNVLYDWEDFVNAIVPSGLHVWWLTSLQLVTTLSALIVRRQVRLWTL